MIMDDMSRLISTRVGMATAVLWRRSSGTRLCRKRWYSLVYRALYLLGLRIWDRDRPPADLIELVEGPNALAPGCALDLGCGTGADSIYLARLGWTVTGIDIVPEAVAIARRRATAAGVGPTFIEGDVTRLRDFGLEGRFSLILDFGCLHTLPEDQRTAYVEGISAVAAPAATFLLYGFARPPRFAPMQAGLIEAEVRERFASAGWEVVSAERVTDDPIVVARARVDRAFQLWRYRLRRHPTVD
jgi:SAM-dependent methyltransferase